MLLYLIVDAAACGERGVVQTAREAANNGVSLIQLRDFTSHDSEYCETASAIMEAIKGTDAKFIVGERPHLVQRLGAHGVHIGEKYRDIRTAREEIGRHALLGVSGFTPEQVVADVGADFDVDYLSVGPVWETVSKPDAGAAIGVEETAARASVSPFASMLIGGITYTNIGELKHTPAAGAVVLGEICRAKNVGFATRNLIWALNKG
jgi:thiamine-phosphate diphosphorylase